MCFKDFFFYSLKISLEKSRFYKQRGRKLQALLTSNSIQDWIMGWKGHLLNEPSRLTLTSVMLSSNPLPPSPLTAYN
ncbi:hypothetical protein CR513_48150, partial [Mucuna pruriens]